MKKVKINLIVSIVYQLIAIIYGFVLPRLILAQFGSEVNGLVHSITQFLGIIGFLDMGVGQVVRSSLYKPLQANDDVQLSCIMLSGGRFYKKIAFSLLVYVSALIVFYPILVNDQFDWFFTVGMIVILSIGSFAQYYFGIIQEQLFHADQKSYLIYSIQIFCNVFNLAVCIGLLKLNCSIHLVKLATALIFLIKPLFYAWHIRKYYRINRKITYDQEPIKQKWNGVAQHVSAVVLDGTDNIILTLFSTLSNVSVYSVYFMVVNALNGFYQSVAVGIQSAAGFAWAKQDEKEISRLFVTAEMSLHTVTTFVFCCACFLIVPFVRVYTYGLTDADYIQPIFAVLLVLAYGIRFLRTPYNIWILAAGHFKQSQRCHITAAVLNLIISSVTVFRWGLIGIAIGTFIAMCYQTTWMMLYTTKHLVVRSYGCLFKRFSADAVAVILASFVLLNITLQEVSYIGWMVMAVKVSFIALVCVVGVNCVFYPRTVINFIKKAFPKKNKS